MKATHLLSLLVTHETLLATAETSGYGYDDPAQLTFTQPDTRPRPACEYEYEYESANAAARHGSSTTFDPLQALQDGLEVMQSTWFQVWVGTWPTAIDWTAAVLDTHLVSSLTTLSKALESPSGAQRARDVENDLNRYFSQNVAYYFGEDAFSIRNQAYDDILWVVLGWLESVKFIRSHSRRHYCPIDSACSPHSTVKPWQGAQFIEAFSHRARLFYEIGSGGWDESLCGGGMTWNPYLTPYKNAITNELFISASIGMYLYFNGDNNTSPFLYGEALDANYDALQPHDRAHLTAAVKGYDWLKNSGMQNHLGLYVDGFHITNWRHGGTKCDIRNEMVFTYNQGVILSGLRGLWEGTGNTTYLTDAHQLVRDVISATGWSLSSQKPSSRRWSGLGRNGNMEERCDASGRCSQDTQTFKGIFFHHLTLLCEPLPLVPMVSGKTFAASKVLARLHGQSCKEYTTWVAHNARAAVGTTDEEGRFGTWWGANSDRAERGEVEMPPLEEGAVDYRSNHAVLATSLWTGNDGNQKVSPGLHGHGIACSRSEYDNPPSSFSTRDLNDRGRGRTVETQSGGIAVLRALWELLHLD